MIDMETKMTPKEELDSITGYQENMCEKYQIGYPSYLKKKKTPKHVDKEMIRLSKRRKTLSDCKRHGGVDGLDCSLCNLENKFNNLLT